MSEVTRRCSRCGQDKPQPEWSPTDWNRGGWCRDCRSTYYRARYTPKPRPRRPKPAPKPRTYSTTYSATHQRLRKTRGSATDLACVACQGPAHEWAYDRTDPEELTAPWNGKTVTYSADIDHYQPMCKGCHWKLDHPDEAAKTHCPKGHEYAGPNLILKNGHRNCRECSRAYQRRRYRREVAENDSTHADPEPLVSGW